MEILREGDGYHIELVVASWELRLKICLGPWGLLIDSDRNRFRIGPRRHLEFAGATLDAQSLKALGGLQVTVFPDPAATPEEAQAFDAIGRALARETRLRRDTTLRQADRLGSVSYRDWDLVRGSHRHHPFWMLSAFLYGGYFRFLSAPVYGLAALILGLSLAPASGMPMAASGAAALAAGLLGSVFKLPRAAAEASRDAPLGRARRAMRDIVQGP